LYFILIDTWLHVTDEDLPVNQPTASNNDLKIIDQATLEYLMEKILELSSEDANNSNEKTDNVISNEYSQISSPVVKSISSSSSEKLEASEGVINGSEWLWYWSSRPEISK